MKINLQLVSYYRKTCFFFVAVNFNYIILLDNCWYAFRHTLMLECWEYEPHARPTFKDCQQIIDDMILEENNMDLNKIVYGEMARKPTLGRRHMPSCDVVPNLTQYATIRKPTNSLVTSTSGVEGATAGNMETCRVPPAGNEMVEDGTVILPCKGTSRVRPPVSFTTFLQPVDVTASVLPPVYVTNLPPVDVSTVLPFVPVDGTASVLPPIGVSTGLPSIPEDVHTESLCEMADEQQGVSPRKSRHISWADDYDKPVECFCEDPCISENLSEYSAFSALDSSSSSDSKEVPQSPVQSTLLQWVEVHHGADPVTARPPIMPKPPRRAKLADIPKPPSPNSGYIPMSEAPYNKGEDDEKREGFCMPAGALAEEPVQSAQIL